MGCQKILDGLGLASCSRATGVVVGAYALFQPLVGLAGVNHIADAPDERLLCAKEKLLTLHHIKRIKLPLKKNKKAVSSEASAKPRDEASSTDTSSSVDLPKIVVIRKGEKDGARRARRERRRAEKVKDAEVVYRAVNGQMIPVIARVNRTRRRHKRAEPHRHVHHVHPPVPPMMPHVHHHHPHPVPVPLPVVYPAPPPQPLPAPVVQYPMPPPQGFFPQQQQQQQQQPEQLPYPPQVPAQPQPGFAERRPANGMASLPMSEGAEVSEKSGDEAGRPEPTGGFLNEVVAPRPIEEEPADFPRMLADQRNEQNRFFAQRAQQALVTNLEAQLQREQEVLADLEARLKENELERGRAAEDRRKRLLELAEHARKKQQELAEAISEAPERSEASVSTSEGEASAVESEKKRPAQSSLVGSEAEQLSHVQPVPFPLPTLAPTPEPEPAPLELPPLLPKPVMVPTSVVDEEDDHQNESDRFNARILPYLIVVSVLLVAGLILIIVRELYKRQKRRQAVMLDALDARTGRWVTRELYAAQGQPRPN